MSILVPHCRVQTPNPQTLRSGHSHHCCCGLSFVSYTKCMPAGQLAEVKLWDNHMHSSSDHHAVTFDPQALNPDPPNLLQCPVASLVLNLYTQSAGHGRQLRSSPQDGLMQ